MNCQLKRFLFLMLTVLSTSGTAKAYATSTVEIPYSTDSCRLTIWNGKTYIPFFIKGINLGISVPGTQPGELAATREQYRRWFAEIKEAGFNCIRVYTLHYPHFYEELKAYNLANQQHPMFLFQGVWLDEEMEGYTNDLYQMTDKFRTEMHENVDCVHGRGNIDQRFGKAFGTYSADVSPWTLGYIIGREVYPIEVLTTNQMHSADDRYTGTHFSMDSGSATEIWWTKHLDHLVAYEKEQYQAQRPVSVSSWPTLDPIHHPGEVNREEDTVSVDLSKIHIIDAPAGFFISYHAYPYYPDFIGRDSAYQTYSDNHGINSYLGYLTDLKKHYTRYPLLIAEYGVPSSWGVAHYTSSGMNHGGFSEASQGETDIRLLNSMKTANAAGGIQFAWIDEWFKKTWITDPFDFMNRQLWHNVTSAEQNFGLVKFTKHPAFLPWKTFDPNDEITSIRAFPNYDFFELEINLKNPMDVLGECWVSFDTYDPMLGESILPNGIALPSRSEFALHIDQHSARLYVTQAYDLFGIWHKMTTNLQKFQSTATDGAPWQIARWKNNSGVSDVQYIGDMKLNKSFQPESSLDAVTISSDKISVRIPWSLLQYVDPSQAAVFNDDRTTLAAETRESDGIAVSIHYKDKLYSCDSRFTWDKWSSVPEGNVQEQKKTSYWTMYDQLKSFNNAAIAYVDSIDLSAMQSPYQVAAAVGLLANDLDPDGQRLAAVLMSNPKHGWVDLNSDGSFSYVPKNGYSGYDNFEYSVFDGQSLSLSNTVTLKVNKTDQLNASNQQTIVKLYPNPATHQTVVESELIIDTLRVFDSAGKLLFQTKVNDSKYELNVANYRKGFYFVVSEMGGRVFGNRLVIRH